MANYSLSVFDLFMLGIGIYVLIGGISGKGRLYIVENIKEDKVAWLQKFMRTVYLVLGIIMIINAGNSIIKSVFYDYQEIAPAVGDTAAVYDWVTKRDLGSFSFLTMPVLNVITYVCMGLSLGIIGLLIVMLRKCTDKNAKPKPAPGSNPAQAGHILPVSAFDFSEPEEDASADGQPGPQA